MNVSKETKDASIRWPAVHFVKGATSPAHYPETLLPEVVFMGRSNVGKSSLLNALWGRTKMAHTSKSPGKTSEINFFKVDETFMCVDLPGYGYARVSKVMLALWKKMLPAYLAKRTQLVHAFVLVDSRHTPKDSDIETYRWLLSLGREASFVMTKTDKASQKVLAQHCLYFQEALGHKPQIFTISARKPATLDALKEFITSVVKSAPAVEEKSPS
ncbi:MAG: ribosome biogenesis GTP-binding protein YihA/YsxC [Holosporaceae bacterium]